MTFPVFNAVVIKSTPKEALSPVELKGLLLLILLFPLPATMTISVGSINQVPPLCPEISGTVVMSKYPLLLVSINPP
ncbi:hypothetical protein SR1949_38130 [Sphaerospermopsis reniformis]|uniref:Uncharacterized protein n=1 Tax=Sphaerospermopsis reniformis TaxID=531300 RepID=A0A480A170_9CYAN|nr:hypothetical protein SR1949_38130 [Sphaerospermopsis reniformis]